MTTTSRLTGPYCTVPGCVQHADGAVLDAYVKESRRFYCLEHMREIRMAELRLLKQEPVVSEAY